MTSTSHTRTWIADASLTLNCCRRYPKTSEGPVYSVFATVFLQLIVCWISIHVLQEQVRNVSLTPVLSQVQNTRNHVDLWRNEGDCQRADGPWGVLKTTITPFISSLPDFFWANGQHCTRLFCKYSRLFIIPLSLTGSVRQTTGCTCNRVSVCSTTQRIE